MTEAATPSLRRNLLAWLPVLFWCGLIFYLSNLPHLRMTEAWWDMIVRKIAHLVEYAILARLIKRALTLTTAWPRKRVFTTALVGAILYAVSDEFHQNFVEGRVGSVRDIVIDSIGAWLGLVLIP